MQTLIYVGRYDSVDLRHPDGTMQTVRRGGDYTTTPEQAASLLTQAGEWKRATIKKKEHNDG